MFKLIAKDTKFYFDEHCQNAFKTIKEKNYPAPILTGPNFSLLFHIITNYVTKCLEAKALVHATKQVVVHFVFEDTFTSFDVPREIVIDHGAQFKSKFM